MKYLALIAAALLLAACQPPVASETMLPMTEILQELPEQYALKGKVALGEVTVPQGMGTGVGAGVSQENFAKALKDSLFYAGMLARDADKAEYVLNANLLSLDQPFIGFSLTVSTTIDYELVRRQTGTKPFDEPLTLSYEAKFGEALAFNDRIRMATSRALRENITHLIRLLANLDQKELAK